MMKLALLALALGLLQHAAAQGGNATWHDVDLGFDDPPPRGPFATVALNESHHLAWDGPSVPW